MAIGAEEGRSPLLAVLDFCGCGNAEEVGAYLLETLEMCDRQEWPPYEDGHRMLALYVLDAADLLEHGTTIRCSWLTEKGREILQARPRGR